MPNFYKFISAFYQLSLLWEYLGLHFPFAYRRFMISLNEKFTTRIDNENYSIIKVSCRSFSQVKGFWSKGHIQKPELFTSRDAWLNKVNAILLVKPHWLRPIKSAIFWIRRYVKGFLSAWRCGSVKMTEGELKLNNYLNSKDKCICYLIQIYLPILMKV